ncbi:MAG: beta-N-acetylhexosaminidase [Anaerolineales bacterium]
MENVRNKTIGQTVVIIPRPHKIEWRSGEFFLDRDSEIHPDPPNLWNATYLRKLLAPSTAYQLEIRPGSLTTKNSIRLGLNVGLEHLGREGYRLEIQSDAIVIESSGTAGVFYGIQTLRQLLPVEIENPTSEINADWRIPCLLIEDRPRFPWRGFMLDDGRYFHGKETVYITLDLLALQKINILHWHLTEDQGWRVEIKKYPALTEVGSHRAGTSKTMFGKKHDGIPHAGYYTQDDIREIVAYAARRNITVVPEIEMPGHSLAALASYPELACTAGPFQVATHFGVFPDIYCAGKERVFTFLQDVVDEILDLFPSPYIHIGGDEAPKRRWKKCPDCQQRIREQGLADEHGLQCYFSNRIAAYLDSKGRKVMGWNEILREGLVESAVIQFWAGDRQRLIAAVRNQKRFVVMSSYLRTYLDHSYGLMPLSRAYQYEPIPEELEQEDASSILGLEFPLWSEWVPDRPRLDYQVYPRLTAMAETGWTAKDKKDPEDFLRRLENFLIRLHHLGVGFAPLREAEPSRIRQWLGIFSIPLPQTRTAR